MDFKLNIADLLAPGGKQIISYKGQRLIEIGDQILCSVKLRANKSLGPFSRAPAASTSIANTHREQVALGIRPMASLNAFAFGNPERFSSQQAIQQTIEGSGAINNQMGIPSIGGSVAFYDCFNQVPVVNTFSIGLLHQEELQQKILPIQGLKVCLLSPFFQKGRGDSFIHNDTALFLADSLAENQLMEAMLELYEELESFACSPVTEAGTLGALLALCEQNNCGLHIQLEALLPHSSSRSAQKLLSLPFPATMLLAVREEDLAVIQLVAEKWDMNLLSIGETETEAKINIQAGAENLIDITLSQLHKFDNNSKLLPDNKKPYQGNKEPRFNFRKSSPSKKYPKTAKQILGEPNSQDQQWLRQQFDATVQTNNLSINAPTDASLLRIKGSQKKLAFSCDVNPKYIHADPYFGTLIAVAEAARNIIISGATPLATYATLNFGNPNDPLVSWQIQQVLKALKEATYKFKSPLLEVDWSLNNQGITRKGPQPVYPTPVIGMLGVLQDTTMRTGSGFREDGHLIYMIGTPHNDINASVYVNLLQYDAVTPAPVFDLDEEFHIQQHLRKLIRRELVVSAHDIMEGGLFVTLLESSAVYGYGFSIETDTNFRKDAYLFGEHQSRVIISLKPEREDDLVNYLNAQNVPFTRLGEVTGDHIWIDEEDFGPLSQWLSVSSLSMDVSR